MLGRLFSVHRACSSSQLEFWIEPTAGADVFPEAGDEIGPYLLRRELGRGAFARVFLAEQGDLENRLVILKLSTRPTREPWLLARARHSHIVEILSHAVVDDGAFQLICMPFLGGATLGRPRSSPPVPPASRSRGDLLKDLDAVAAAEYSGVNPARAAREILNSLTDCQAMAWITARLADALDHAQCRDVIHGDVKPSNILLTADGNPMLLDFNLARNWSFDETNGPLEEPGGTLAYMAPERFGALASGGSRPPSMTWRSSEVEPSEGDDPHRADVHSLGIVLLEALTAASPPSAAMRDRDAPARAAQKLRNTGGGIWLVPPKRGALAVVRAARVRRPGQTIPPALGRPFCEKTLPGRPPRGPIPAGIELAEDLDPLAGRPAAGLRRRAVLGSDPAPLCARRTTRSCSSPWGLALVMCLVATYLVVSRIQSRWTLQDMAMHKLARNWDDIESPCVPVSSRPAVPGFRTRTPPRQWRRQLTH